VDVAGGAVLNDMLLGNNLEFATGGLPPFLILWSKAAGTPNEVKAIAAVGGTPSTLYTRDPDVKSIKDLSSRDKIAVAGVKSSQVAIVLQMAAAEAFGDKDYAKLDPLTVTMRDADAVGVLKSGKGELTGHFTYDPYRAARDFKTLAKAAQSDAELTAMIRQPDAQYTVTPNAVMKFATFMARIGTLKAAPKSWKDMFFPEAYGLAGS
jgi:hypothetical protein